MSSWAWQFASPLLPSSLIPNWMKSIPELHQQSSLSDDLDELLQRNQSWARSISTIDPQVFKRNAETQAPKILWIGCSDSRVPETEIFKARPGDFFVHRNIANVVREDDPSLNSVIEYAVEALKVQHIVICGHYGCGGVQAAMNPPEHLTSTCNWIKPIKEVFEEHRESLTEPGIDSDTTWRALVHLNVNSSVEIIKKHPSVIKRLASSERLLIHNWVYDIRNGLITAQCEPVAENALAMKRARSDPPVTQ